MVTFVKDEHSTNALYSISVIEFGIVMVSKASHPLNALSGITVNEFDNMALF